MSMEGLFNVLAGFHPLSGDFKMALEREMVPLSLPKNHVLLEAPKISTHAYYLHHGFAMSYSFINGRKITEAFWKHGQIIASFESFFKQTPSMEFIQLLQKSEILCISYDSVMDILAAFPEAQQICRAILIAHYVQSRARIRDMQQMNARQRFEKLLKEYPDIELTVSQDAIATYLGITAQSLARMKRKEG